MTDNTQADSPPTATTAGGLLKAARQAVGMHLAVLSANLKVPVRQLEALEADEYLVDQSPVFARGLAASVCRQLRVDPAPVLALMPLSASHLASTGAARQPFTAPANLGRLTPTSPVAAFKTVWISLGMLLLIAGLIWLPNFSQWAWFERLRASLWVSEPAAQTASPVAESVALGATGPGFASSEPEPKSLTEIPPVLPMVPPAMAQAAASGTLGAPAVSESELVFSAQNMSWIEVRDAQKQLVWNGVLNAGDSKRLPVSLPVSVVVGRSDAIQLSVKGQPFDLKPHTQVNTARFEVKP
jgi:cytoskeleton protein RodZ